MRPQQPATRAGTVHHWPGVTGAIGNTGHDDCLAIWAGIKRYHLGKGYADIAYHYGACVHGQLLPGRPLDRTAGANGNAALNVTYGALCWLLAIGQDPTAAQEAAVVAGSARIAPSAPRVHVPHSTVRPAGTYCPGPEVREWIATYDRYRPLPTEPAEGEDDMTLVYAPSGVWYLLTGSKLIAYTARSANNARAAGMPAHAVDSPTWAGIVEKYADAG